MSTKPPKSDEQAEEKLMDFKLPNGKRLGDATGEEVREAAEIFKKQSLAAFQDAKRMAAHLALKEEKKLNK